RHRGRPVRGGLRAVPRPARRAPTRAIAGRCGHRTLAGGGRATGVAQGRTVARSRAARRPDRAAVRTGRRRPRHPHRPAGPLTGGSGAILGATPVSAWTEGRVAGRRWVSTGRGPSTGGGH